MWGEWNGMEWTERWNKELGNSQSLAAKPSINTYKLKKKTKKIQVQALWTYNHENCHFQLNPHSILWCLCPPHSMVCACVSNIYWEDKHQCFVRQFSRHKYKLSVDDRYNHTIQTMNKSTLDHKKKLSKKKRCIISNIYKYGWGVKTPGLFHSLCTLYECVSIKSILLSSSQHKWFYHFICLHEYNVNAMQNLANCHFSPENFRNCHGGLHVVVTLYIMCVNVTHSISMLNGKFKMSCTDCSWKVWVCSYLQHQR